MTDLATIRIPVDSSDMVQAVRESKNLERGIKMLVDAFDAGVIGAGQFSKGLLQLKREYQDLFTSSQQATAAVRGHAKSLQESAAAAEQAAAAKNNLAMATKRAETAFALANQKAKEELQTLRNRAEFAWAMAMQREKESQNAVQAAARQAQAEAKLTAEILRRRQAQEASNEANAQAFQAQIGGNLGLGARGISAAGSASAMEAEIERLRQKYDQIYAASQIYERSLQELNQAHLLGITSIKQHEAAVESLNAEYQAFQSGTAGANNRFAKGVQQTANGLNDFGVITQQVGYQVGDFLVQVQSGTNAFVAFGQQATQLVGFLPMLAETFGVAAGRLNIIAAVLSVVIPLTTAVAAAFMRVNENANSAASSVMDLAKAQGQLNQASADYALKLEMLRFGVDTQAEAFALREIYDLTAQIQRLNREYQQTDSLSRRQAIAEEVLGLKEQLSIQQGIVDEVNSKRQAYETALAINKQMQAVELAHARAIGDAKREQEAMTEAAQDALSKYSMMRTVAAGLADELARAAANTRAAADAALTAMRIEFSPAGGAMSQYGGRGTTSDRPITDQFGNEIDFGLPDPGRGVGRAGGAAQTTVLENKMEEIYRYLELDKYLLEQETIAYEQRQDVLRSALENKLITLQEYNELEKAISTQHQQDLANIEREAQQRRLSETANVFGQLANIASVGGQKTAKAVAVFQAIEGTINAYGAAIKALNTPGLSLAGRFAAYASVLAAGLKGVAAIRSAGGIGGGTGGASGGRGSATVAPTAAAPTPQTVFIDSIDPKNLYSGETLINLFEALYDENDRRGKVFVVAR